MPPFSTPFRQRRNQCKGVRIGAVDVRNGHCLSDVSDFEGLEVAPKERMFTSCVNSLWK